jgi:DNA-binding transcriptional LysR family regulator
MSLQHLRTFVEVFRQRSISGAARNLGLTQPAVSQHIAALEAAIERDLFERHAKGVLPTAAAEELAASLGDRLDVAEAALAAARARSSDMTGAVRLIGNGDFLAEMVAPRLLGLLQSGLRVRLHAGDREGILGGLTEGQYDLGICAFRPPDRRLRSRQIHAEPIYAVASPKVVERMMRAPDLGTALMQEAILTYTLERPLVDEWLEANNWPSHAINPALIGQDLRCLRGLLGHDFGWTALPGYLCEAQLARGELAEIPAPVGRPSHPYFLVWMPSALRHPRVAFAHRTLLAELAGDDGG